MKFSNVILVSAALLVGVIAGLNLFDRIVTGGTTNGPAPESAPLESAPPVSASAADGPPLNPSAPAAPASSEQLALEIERALGAADAQQRETAFNNLLPQLLQSDPSMVVAMVARQPPGEARDALREHVTRQWIARDRQAAIDWIDTLDEVERRASAITAVRTLAASSPPQAIEAADHFDVGRDDGSLEHLVQVWATENLDEALQWLATQPEGPRTEQLRARIEQVRDQQQDTAIPE